MTNVDEKHTFIIFWLKHSSTHKNKMYIFSERQGMPLANVNVEAFKNHKKLWK